MRDKVKHLCETVGQDGGYIINGGCGVPYDTKPENYRAMIDTVMEYGVYDPSRKPMPKPAPAGKMEAFRFPKMITPWEVKKAELGGVQGDEDLIRKPWETLESLAYVFLWQWVL